MKLKAIVLPVFVMCVLFARAQREADNWLFGNWCRLNFTAGAPAASRSPTILDAGTACMSNPSGELLYYSNGFYVYDRLHQIMPHGILSGLPRGYGQPVLTVPRPGSDSIYYLFYIENTQAHNYEPKLCYAIINMRLRNGLGDVEIRDQPLLGDSVCLKLTASLHCNKKDVWLIGHLKNSNKYFSLLITSTGITTTPIYSTGVPVDESNKENGNGYMKVAPLGNKIAAAFMGDKDLIEVSDFNSQTGEILSPKIISTHPGWTFALPGIGGTGPFGIEFSPTGKYLYVSATYNTSDIGGTGSSNLFYQFNASAADAPSIQASKIILDSASFQNEMFKGVQLANDGKIYVSNNSNFLHAVNNPDASGQACNFIRRSINTGLGTSTNYDLPVFLQSYLRYPVIATGNCSFQNISFIINNVTGFNNIIWDFGDPASGSANSSSSFAPTHIYTNPGVYTATAVLINANGCGADTIRKLVHAGPFKVFLGADTTICAGDTLRLKVAIPMATNTWSDQSGDTILKITSAGAYWVNVHLGECTATDTIVVAVDQPPSFSLGNDTAICTGHTLALGPSSQQQDWLYAWSTGAITPDISVRIAANYWLRITDAYHCTSIDTVVIQNRTPPVFSLGSDTSLCQQTLVLVAGAAGANNFLWNTGSHSSSISVTGSGTYWAEAVNQGCAYRDSINVNFKPYPIVNLGPDTTLCSGQSLQLHSTGSSTIWTWQDGSSGETYTATLPGLYSAKENRDGCVSGDTIIVKFAGVPKFSFETGLTVCVGQQLVLRPLPDGVDGMSYQWSTGSSQPFIQVDTPGLYSLKMVNRCGEAQHTVRIDKGACGFYLPSAFTPNGDGLNDVFKPISAVMPSYFKMRVFNRWGELVFQSADASKGWNGVFRGRLQEQGGYAWIIEMRETDQEKMRVLKGTVLLVNN
jgi:gliding motility-associated-like protein